MLHYRCFSNKTTYYVAKNKHITNWRTIKLCQYTLSTLSHSGKAIKKVSNICVSSRSTSIFSTLCDLDYYMSLSNKRPSGLENLWLKDKLHEHTYELFLRLNQILSQALMKNQKNSSSPGD